MVPLMLALQPATPRFLNPTGGAAASRRKPDRSNHQQRRAERQPARAVVATDEGTPVEREQARPGTSPRSTAGPAAMLGAAVENAKLVVAGALSAAVSRTAVAPLERLKMEQLLVSSRTGALQTALSVWKHEGFRGFWKGNALNVARLAPFKALNFLSFELYLRAMAAHLGHEAAHLKYAAGAAAGITATLVCFPLDTLRTRMMAPGGAAFVARSGGPAGALRAIAQREGLGALYSGAVPAIIGMAPAGALYYGVFHSLCARHRRALEGDGSAAAAAASGAPRGQQDVPTAFVLLYGAAAGVTAELLVYPLEVLRRHMQVAGPAAPGGTGAAAAAAAAATAAMRGRCSGGAAARLAAPSLRARSAAAVGRIAVVARSIYANHGGLGGFFAGIRPSVLQALPNAALSFWVYESVKQALAFCPP